MSKQSQRAAVFAAISATLEAHNIEFTQGMDVKSVLTKEMKSEVNDSLCKGFRDGSIELSTEYPTDAELRSYTSGLISNWLRKDPELNGGIKYVPKNPGSRTGSTDPQMKALKILLSQTADADDKAEIQSFIDVRATELNAGKVKAKPIDFSVLPAELQARFAKH
jgi:hypothetical protein